MPNAIAGLEAFIEAWDAAAPAATAAEGGEPGPKVGPDGQINVEGSATCASASIFVPSDPRFAEALEPGVRSLCLALIEKLGCVTYSSCQGHRASTPGGRYRRRHVGVVPRNAEEAARLDAALEQLCRETNRAFPESKVRVLLVITTVHGDHSERPCLDLEFFGEDVEESVYFRHTELLTQELESKLRSFAADRFPR